MAIATALSNASLEIVDGGLGLVTVQIDDIEEL
jgi:hypothetical protein